MAELTVWYNTRCPVCDAGIRHQKQRLIEAVKSGRIEFRDINLEPGRTRPLRRVAGGHQAQAARHRCGGAAARRRRCRDRSLARDAGRGLAWRRLLGNPVLLPVTRFVYDRFADLLYAWNRREGRW